MLDRDSARCNELMSSISATPKWWPCFPPFLWVNQPSHESAASDIRTSDADVVKKIGMSLVCGHISGASGRSKGSTEPMVCRSAYSKLGSERSILSGIIT